jgi:hypothetical protein
VLPVWVTGRAERREGRRRGREGEELAPQRRDEMRAPETREEKATHELVIVQMILMPYSRLHAQEALLMRLPTMLIKRIGIIKALPTKLAHGMILGHMLVHLLGSVERVLVREDLLVVGAQVADGGLVGRTAVTLEVGPGLED